MTEASERGRQRGKREGGGEQGKKEVGNDFLLRRRLQMERESRLEREEERPWNLLFAVASSVRQSVRPSVNEGSEKSLRFGERDWSRTTFTAEAEGSAKKGKWAAAHAAQRPHWQGTRAEGERHMRRWSSNTCQDREQARSTSPGPQVRGARQ